MGGCTSTSNHVTVDPYIGDTFKRNNKSLEGSIDNFGSNSSPTGTVGIDSYDNDRNSMQVYEAIYQRQWWKVTELLTSTKTTHNLDYVDRYKRTCLHWACIRSCPPSIAQNLITSYSDALLMQDYLGKTPLHLACEFGSHATVYLLLGLSSQVTLLRDTEFGRTPLAEAIICHRPYPVIESLLDSNPKQVNIPDKNGNIPTVSFFRMTLGLFISFTGKAKATWNCCNHNIEDLIEIARVLLNAESLELENSPDGSHPQDHIEHIDRNQGDNILHNSIKSPTCPLAFVEFLLSYNPELADEFNRAGNLPIHIAAALSPDCSTELSNMYKCNGCDKPQSDDDVYYYRCDPNVFFRQILCHDCISESQICKYKKNSSEDKIIGTIRALLSIKPQYANTRNQRDMAPLNIAIESGHNWDEEIWDEIISGHDKISATSTCEVKFESNHENFIINNLEREADTAHLTKAGYEEIDDNDNVRGSLLSVSSIDSSKSGTAELRNDDNSLQASLSSIRESNDVALQASITENENGCELMDGIILDVSQEDESARTQLDAQIQETENDLNTKLVEDEISIDQLEDNSASIPVENDIIENVNTSKTAKLMSVLKTSVITSQGLFHAIEIGCAALT